MENLVRCSKSQPFSRSVIESVFRLSDLGRCDASKVDPFGKILTQKAIGILAKSSLQGAIGVGKIDLSL